MELYRITTVAVSKIIAEAFSTSFSAGMRRLNKTEKEAIYAIYGFVRIADEIVDTFHEFDKKTLLEEFIRDTGLAIERGVSANPVLHSFQWAVNKYNIGKDLIDAFFTSMKMDLTNREYQEEDYKQYIYGSAEVVGLMCLCVFYVDNQDMYDELVPSARKLGEAFQKINFLRDIRSDQDERGRIYFPGLDTDKFDVQTKKLIEEEVRKDFHQSLPGIRKLDKRIRFGVYLAYRYYYELYRKIRKKDPEQLLQARIRVADAHKFWLLITSYIRFLLRLI